TPTAELTKVMDDVRGRYPELQVLSTPQFARRSGLYWMTQTGAGGAIALAGLLGMLVGSLIVSQIIYAMTIDRLDEFATLQALGASARLPLRVVLLQALVCAACGAAVGGVALWPLAELVRL